jgi:hypothetical protein
MSSAIQLLEGWPKFVLKGILLAPLLIVDFICHARATEAMCELFYMVSHTVFNLLVHAVDFVDCLYVCFHILTKS